MAALFRNHTAHRMPHTLATALGTAGPDHIVLCQILVDTSSCYSSLAATCSSPALLRRDAMATPTRHTAPRRLMHARVIATEGPRATSVAVRTCSAWVYTVKNISPFHTTSTLRPLRSNSRMPILKIVRATFSKTRFIALDHL